MNNIKFRTLYPSEIEVRPQSKAKNSDTKILLLYIDSRAVTTLLDETVGNLNWQNEFYEAGGLLFNKLSIRHPETGEWISRSETGSESTIEQEKGKVSDTFKRCLSRFGVTELYSSPRIEVQDDGYGCTGYKVSEIAYDDSRKITHLVIINRFGKEMVRWDANTGQTRQPVQPQPQAQYSPKALIDNMLLNVEVIKMQPGVNMAQLQAFVSYYTNRLSNGRWNGDFDTLKLWTAWQKKNLK